MTSHFERIPPTTSASQLTAYAMCARKFFYTYCSDAEREFVSTNLVLGSAVHSAIDWFYTERLEGRTPKIEGAEDILGIDLYASTIDANVRWKESTPESLEAEGRRLVRLYLTAHGDDPVVAVEEPFEVELVDPRTGEVLGRPMKGYFDLVLPEKTLELKTSARGWNEFDLVRHLQLGAYSFARHAIAGRASTVEARVLVKLKKEPRIETYTLDRDAHGLGWWLSAAAEIESAIEAGIFPPSPSPLCHECEYQKACANWTGEDEPARASERRLPLRQNRPAQHHIAL